VRFTLTTELIDRMHHAFLFHRVRAVVERHLLDLQRRRRRAPEHLTRAEVPSIFATFDLATKIV